MPVHLLELASEPRTLGVEAGPETPRLLRGVRRLVPRWEHPEPHTSSLCRSERSSKSALRTPVLAEHLAGG